MRAATSLRVLGALGPVAGNHGCFLFDFSPKSVVFRVTQAVAPRILYAFQGVEGGGVTLGELLRKVRGRDISAKERVLGGAVVDTLGAGKREVLSGSELHSGVLVACEVVCQRLEVDKW